jgi:hypothetical protein
MVLPSAMASECQRLSSLVAVISVPVAREIAPSRDEVTSVCNGYIAVDLPSAKDSRVVLL